MICRYTAVSLTLRELEAGAGAALTVFLALFLAGVPGQKTVLLDEGAGRVVDQGQSPGDAVTDGAGLAGA